MICEDGLSKGIYKILPEEYKEIECYDHTGKIIVPGFVDLHVHAPQYPFRGLGMDSELIDWLNEHAFVEEQKYANPDYARKAYTIFVEDLKKSVTTRACVFGTLHTEATGILMELLEESGMIAYVGKVNMDRNSPDYLCEESAEKSVSDTRKWLVMCERFKRIKPILTPRFIPSCSDELMQGLQEVQNEYRLPVQSHLSENLGEIEWVKELCKEAAFYGDAYDRFGMFGGECKTIMAHCVHSSEEEKIRMKERGVYVAHCPQSNANLSSGIAPIRKYLDGNLLVGIGTDVAAGCSLSLFRAMAEAIQFSKMYFRMADNAIKPLKVEEVFYMGTKGGGSFFGKVGSFEEGYEFDALVLDDTEIRTTLDLGVKERLERFIYLFEDKMLIEKYVKGQKIHDSNH